MEYLKYFEFYKIDNEMPTSSGKVYTFSTGKYMYMVSFMRYSDTKYYSVGFKAKTDDEYFFDMNKITNENPYRVMQTVIGIAMKFSESMANEMAELNRKFTLNIDIQDFFSGFVFSFVGDKKKAEQRLNLYKRYIPAGWSLTCNDGIYYLTKE